LDAENQVTTVLLPRKKYRIVVEGTSSHGLLQTPTRAMKAIPISVENKTENDAGSILEQDTVKQRLA
jgi:hypothetical protein